MDQCYSNASKEALTKEQCLFVGGLNPKVKRSEVLTHFSKYGKIANLFQKIDSITNCNKGYAFVHFKHKNGIEKVQQETQVIGGRQVECKRSQGRQYNTQDLSQTIKCKIYVGNLQPNFTKDDLIMNFSAYGEIKHAYLIQKPDSQNSKGFGYVHFENEKSAQNAIIIENRKLNNPLMVQKFDPSFKTGKKSNSDKPKKDNISKGKKKNGHTPELSNQLVQRTDCKDVNKLFNQLDGDLKPKIDQLDTQLELDIIIDNLQLQKKISESSQTHQQHPQMHQQNQRQDELTQPANFRKKGKNTQKRWSDYARAVDKQKTFDLYNKKMIASNQKNTAFDNYNVHYQNQADFENYGNSGGYNSNYLEQQNTYVAPPLEYNQYDYNEPQMFHHGLQQPNTENFACYENQYQFQDEYVIPTTNLSYSNQNDWNKLSASQFDYPTRSNSTENTDNDYCGEFFYQNENQQNQYNYANYQSAEQEYDCVRDYDSRGFYQYTC